MFRWTATNCNAYQDLCLFRYHAKCSNSRTDIEDLGLVIFCTVGKEGSSTQIQMPPKSLRQRRRDLYGCRCSEQLGARYLAFGITNPEWHDCIESIISAICDKFGLEAYGEEIIEANRTS